MLIVCTREPAYKVRTRVKLAASPSSSTLYRFPRSHCSLYISLFMMAFILDSLSRNERIVRLLQALIKRITVKRTTLRDLLSMMLRNILHPVSKEG